MGDAQTTFSADELLSDHDTVTPLFAGGVQCHGGFDEDGQYVSPRTKFRVPGIEAWQAQHTELFGTEMLAIPLETWPAHMPRHQRTVTVVGRVAKPRTLTLCTRWIPPGSMS